MLTGLPPYYDENTNEMYRKILSDPLHFPGPEIVPPAAKDLLTQLLDRDPKRRLGANGASEIKAHQFFHSIDWRKLLQRKYEPSFKPNVVSRFPLTSRGKRYSLSYPRSMLSIQPTSTKISHQKRPPTRMSMARCYHRLRSSSLQAGPITGPLRA
jgi:serum/glucocorticoid-regulated kinase 2